MRSYASGSAQVQELSMNRPTSTVRTNGCAPVAAGDQQDRRLPYRELVDRCPGTDNEMRRRKNGMSHPHPVAQPTATSTLARQRGRLFWLVPALSVLVRVVTAAGLAIDAYVHLKVASDYDVIPGSISGGDLFRLESAVAIAVALLVLVRPGRLAYALAFVVAASALGAVLLYTHVDVGELGPLPDLYEPVWFAEKTASAVAEGVATVAAAVGFLIEVLRRRA
jgi:hypothetical protein